MSHTNRGLIATTFLLISAAHAAAEPAVAQSKLNLRVGPGAAFGIMAVLPPGTRVNTLKCTDDWCRVQLSRQIGYVSRDFLKTGADSYASAAPPSASVQAPAAAEPKASLTGPRIWRWRDDDWRDEHWRKIEWHNRMSGR